MWPFKKKTTMNDIKREDVVQNIIELDRMQNQEINNVTEREKEIEALMEKGKKSSNRNLQLSLAKRINLLRAENDRSSKRIQFLNSNLQVLNNLKMAIDDKGFLENNSNLPLNKLLQDQKQLSSFLSSVNGIKAQREDSIVNVLDTFEAFEEEQEENEKIYGKSEADDALLSMFESSASEQDTYLFDGETVVEEQKNLEKVGE